MFYRAARFIRLFTMSFVVLVTGHKCEGIDPKNRIDCGYNGIQRNECENTKGCCFDSHVPNVPFCFRGKQLDI